jgi:hypothetical protein
VNSRVQKAVRPRFTLIEAFVVLVILFVVGLRLTVAALFVILVLLYLLFPLHRSRRALWGTTALLALAVLIPFDVYVRGFYGSLYGSKHSGPRIVRVVWGRPIIQGCLDKYGEFISGGCVTRINDTRWMLVWD